MTNIPSQTGSDWHHDNCFGCGKKNPLGLHADFRFDSSSGEVRFEYTPGTHHEGAPGYTHGGILATLLDEAQGDLCFHLGHFAMTDQLHTSYHKAVPLGVPFHVRAWLTAVRKRRLYTRATIHSPNGDLMVSSEARWYVMNERVYTRMFGSVMDIELTRHILAENKKRGKEIRKKIRNSKK